MVRFLLLPLILSGCFLFKEDKVTVGVVYSSPNELPVNKTVAHHFPDLGSITDLANSEKGLVAVGFDGYVVVGLDQSQAKVKPHHESLSRRATNLTISLDHELWFVDETAGWSPLILINEGGEIVVDDKRFSPSRGFGHRAANGELRYYFADIDQGLCFRTVKDQKPTCRDVYVKHIERYDYNNDGKNDFLVSTLPEGFKVVNEDLMPLGKIPYDGVTAGFSVLKNGLLSKGPELVFREYGKIVLTDIAGKSLAAIEDPDIENSSHFPALVVKNSSGAPFLVVNEGPYFWRNMTRLIILDRNLKVLYKEVLFCSRPHLLADPKGDGFYVGDAEGKVLHYQLKAPM